MQNPTRRAALPTLAMTGLLAGLVVATPASAATGGYGNPAPITITDDGGYTYGSQDTDIVLGSPTGAGSSYPSTIAVEAPAGTTLNYVGVSMSIQHENMDDVDLLLVAPNGQAVTLLSDAGGDNAYDGSLYFNRYYDTYPDSDPLNTYGSPVDWDTTAGDTDTFPAPAPAPSAVDLEAFDGGPVAGTWSLYAVDDSDGNVGVISDWSLDLYYTVPASPSPSAVTVSGLPKSVTDVNITLNDIDLDYLDDTELVLESPDGRRAHVLSDAGGSDPVTDLTLTLDDEAAAPLRRNVVPVTGTYQPVDYYDYDDPEFVGGTNAEKLPSALSTFDGVNPNGTWKLYVAQEYGGNAGAISGGWSLQITTADASATPVITSPADGSRDTDGTVTVTGTAKAGSLVKVTAGDKTRNTVAEDGTWTVTFGDLADGTQAFAATATDATGNVSAAATVSVVVDTVAPRVGKTTPKNKAKGVKTSITAKVKFSEAMKAASVKRAVKLVAPNGTKVKAKLVYKAGTNVLTINPKKDLMGHTTYKIVVKKTAKDLAGHTLATGKKSTFTTR